MHLAQELLMNVQCSGNSRSFAKKTRVLKIRSIVASHWKLTMINQEDHLIEANLLKTICSVQLLSHVQLFATPWIAACQASLSITNSRSSWEVVKELNADHSTVTQHLKQIKKVIKLDKWVPYELTTNQKNHSFCCLLLIYTTVNHFSMRLSGVTKSGLYTTTSEDQLSGWTEKKLQSTS